MHLTGGTRRQSEVLFVRENGMELTLHVADAKDKNAGTWVDEKVSVAITVANEIPDISWTVPIVLAGR